MMSHVEIGARILGQTRSPVLRAAAEIARTHHEHWDGSGYLLGLTGEEIPLAGRITAVADVFDALTHERPYKSAWDLERAAAEIVRQAGRQFDPRVVEAFTTIDLSAVSNQHQRPSATGSPARGVSRAESGRSRPGYTRRVEGPEGHTRPVSGDQSTAGWSNRQLARFWPWNSRFESLPRSSAVPPGLLTCASSVSPLSLHRRSSAAS